MYMYSDDLLTRSDRCCDLIIDVRLKFLEGVLEIDSEILAL